MSTEMIPQSLSFETTEPELGSLTESPTSAAYEGAYTHTVPLAQALDAKTLGVFNVEVGYAVGTVLAKLPLLATLRPKMALLIDFDVAHFDELGSSARALAYAHARYTANNTPIDLTDTRVEAIKLRAQLKDDAVSPVRRGTFKPTLLTNLHNTTGDSEIAGDLLALFAAFRAEPEKLAGKTPVTAEELERAATLANTLMLGVAQRESANSEETRALGELRVRIFTLFSRHYTQVQRAVAFLRFDAGDAAHYAPSLYASHAKRAKDPVPAAPGAPPATPATPATAPKTPAAPNSALEALLAASPQHAVPQNDPFTR